jgi:hypothetical protein
MNIEPTIPCPVCEAPIFVRQINLPTGEIARIYAEPLSTDEEVIAFHQHQMSDTEAALKH